MLLTARSSDVQGIDPRTCYCDAEPASASTASIRTHADYTSCGLAATPSGSLYIPNPMTGTFDSFGQFTQPWQFNMGLQLHYDFSPRVSGNVTIANLVNQCFGGSSTSWTRQYAQFHHLRLLAERLLYQQLLQRHRVPATARPTASRLNPYFSQPFIPSYGDNNSFNYPLPINLYFQLQLKI